MPITDPALPTLFLDALERSGVGFVVLHKEEEIGTSLLDGDLDIAVETLPDDVMRISESALRGAGIRPTVRWAYDVGGTQAFFLSTPTGSEGMQADLMYDLDGRGRYGVRSNEILDRRSKGKRYPVPEPLDAALYQLSKRWNKGQDQRTRESLAEVRSFQTRIVTARVDELFEARTAASLHRLLDGSEIRPPRGGSALQHATRYLRRIIEPSGFWADIVLRRGENHELVERLLERFSRWLPLSVSTARPTGSPQELRWWATAVLPSRLVPRILISFAESRSVIRPDLTILGYEPPDLDAHAGAIVTAMAERLAL